MIKEIVKSSPNKYGRYFLSIEAPGDEVDNEPIKKSNTKVIDVRPNNRTRIDFTDGIDEEVEEIPEEPSEETQVEDDLDFDKSDDFTQDEEDISDENDNSSPIDDGTDPTITDLDNQDDIQDNKDVESSINDEENPENIDNSNNTEVEPTVTDGDNTEVNVDDSNGPEIDNSEDFNSDVEGDMVDDNGQPIEGEQAPAEEVKRGPGLEYDSTRKYILFENYLSLTNSITNYISKLEVTMGDNINENKIIKTATEKLREIHDLCYDYMTLKFEISTYVQSLLFFQNIVIMIQLVFDLLEKSREKLKNNNK